MKGLDNLELLRTKTGFVLRDKRVLELGTGWHGIDLLLFYLLDAECITTVDHLRHLTLQNLQAQVRHLESPASMEKLVLLGYNPSRFRRLQSVAGHASSLHECLEQLHVKYIILPSSNYAELPIDRNSVDLFYSESVFQRIPEDHLRTLIRTVQRRLMADNAVFFHRIDQKDINAQEHVDATLWGLEYLKYGDVVFNLFLSGKFNNQNRLRESDFLALIEECGASPVYVESKIMESDLGRLKTFKIAKRFREKSLEDLAVRASKIVGRYPRGPEHRALERVVLMA